METLAYARKHAGLKGADASLVRGRAYQGMNRDSEAERALRAGMSTDPSHQELRRELGIFLAVRDRCKEALPLLKTDPEHDAQLTLSRCQIVLGDHNSAHQSAVATAAESEDRWTRDHAGWLASVAALNADPAPDFPDEETPVSDMWSSLLKEEQAIDALKAQMSGDQVKERTTEP